MQILVSLKNLNQVYLELTGPMDKHRAAVYKTLVDSLDAAYDAKARPTAKYYLEIETIGVLKKQAADLFFPVILTKEVEDRLQALERLVRSWEEEGEFCALGVEPKPYGYQKGDAGRMRRSRAIINANEMGLGKTLEALLAIEPGYRVLVVTTASTKDGWRVQAARSKPNFKATILEGRKGFRWPEENEIVIINYDIIPNVEYSVPEKLILILDEGHRLIAQTSQRTNKIRSIIQGCSGPPKGITATGKELAKYQFAGCLSKGGKVWVLTGTPLRNRPLDLYYLLNLIGLLPETFGTWQNFMAEFRGRTDGSKYSWGKPKLSAIAKLQRVIIRRDQEEVLDLPGKIHSQVAIEPTKETKSYFSELSKVLDESGISLEQAMDQVAQQGDSHPIATVLKMLAIAKIPAMMDIVEQYEETETPVIIASAHVAPIEHLADRPGWKVIHGGISGKDRKIAQDSFQAGELKGLAITINAAGEGLTLHRASHMVFVDQDYVAAQNLQCEARIYRIGQSKVCHYKFLCWDHPLDHKKEQILRNKRRFAKESIDQVITLKSDSSLVDSDLDPRKRWLLDCCKKLETENKWVKDSRESAMALYRAWQMLGSLQPEWWSALETIIVKYHSDVIGPPVLGLF